MASMETRSKKKHQEVRKEPSTDESSTSESIDSSTALDKLPEPLEIHIAQVGTLSEGDQKSSDDRPHQTVEGTPDTAASRLGVSR